MEIQFALTVITGLIENLVFSGILFGWPFLEYVLVKDGYFSEHCNYTLTNVTKVTTCKSQAASLNLVYYVGIISMSFTSLPLGYFFDRYGTWKTRTLGTSLTTIGAVFLVASTADLSWCLYPGMFIFVTGRNTLFLTNAQTANLYPRIRAVILNVFDGMLSSSACVCLVIKLAYGSGIKLQTILMIFLVLTLLPWIRTYTLMPEQFIPYPFKNPDLKYGIFEWSGCYSESKSEDKDEVKPLMSNKETKSSMEKTKSFKNILFWTNTYQFSMYSLRNVFFDGSMYNWLHAFISNETEISKLINLYGYLLFFAFVISVIGGLLVDGFTNFYKGKKALYFGLLASSVIVSIFVTLLSVGAVAEQPIMTFVFSLLGQGFIYGSATTFIAYVFPMKDFGKVYGVTIFISGLILLLEFGMFKLTLIYDPTFKIVNIVLLAFSISTLIHPITWAKCGLKYELKS